MREPVVAPAQLGIAHRFAGAGHDEGRLVQTDLGLHIRVHLRPPRALSKYCRATARIAKVIMVACLAAFAFLVTFDNLTDYGTNFEFVRHVLSMDTTFPDNGLLYRRVSSSTLWNTAYYLIILGEGLTGLTLAIAAIALLRQLRSGADRFNRAKRFVSIGAACGFLVGFSVLW
jgi:predicted small integral membrane protein